MCKIRPDRDYFGYTWFWFRENTSKRENSFEIIVRKAGGRVEDELLSSRAYWHVRPIVGEPWCPAASVLTHNKTKVKRNHKPAN